MASDRDLLFGLMAIQTSKVSAEAMTPVTVSWAANPTEDLSNVLVENKLLTPADRVLILDLVEETIRSHSGDVRQALSSFGGPETAIETLGIPSASAHALKSLDTILKDSVTLGTFPFDSTLPERSEQPDTLRVLAQPERYKNPREHASGGMGRVLIVHDTSLNRDVALKELLPELESSAGGSGESQHDDTPMAARFMREARITGQLEHPSIVPVYELGRKEDGTQYYTMKLVRGQSMSQRLRQCQSLRDRLELLPHFVDLCQAIAYAHSRGVIHRDIKPSNVMVGEFGETVVIDWGLAKNKELPDDFVDASLDNELRIESNEKTQQVLTAYGHAFGTPSYMSPEQAKGELDRIDERSDVYSLGVVLYELLTGRRPFRGRDKIEILSKVIADEPKPVLMSEASAPAELAAICMRAMAKDPEQRYPSAKDLAEEIQRFQSGALVEAFSYGFRRRFARFIQRNRSIVGTVTVGVMAAIVFAVVAFNRERSLRFDAERAEAQAVHEKDRAEEESFFSLMQVVPQYLRDRKFGLSAAALSSVPKSRRHWEWGRYHYLGNLDQASFRASFLPGVDAPSLPTVTFDSGQARFAAFQTQEGDFSVWDMAQREPLFAVGSFSDKRAFGMLGPNGRHLAAVRETLAGHRGELWDVQAEEHFLPFETMYHWAWMLEFSADGRRLATRLNLDKLEVRDIEDRRVVCTIHDQAFEQAAVYRDGTLVATRTSPGIIQTERHGRVHVWDVSSGSMLCELPIHGVDHIAFLANGARLVTAREREVQIWDARSGKALSEPIVLSETFQAMAVDPAGRWLVAADSAGVITVLDMEQGGMEQLQNPHDAPVSVLAFNVTGTHLVSGGEDRRVVLWEVATWNPLRIFTGHDESITRLAVGPSGRRILSAGSTEVKVWDAEFGHRTIAVYGEEGLSAGISPDQSFIFVVDENESLLEIDPHTGRSIEHALPSTTGQSSHVVSPAGHYVLSGSSGRLSLLNIASNRLTVLAEDGNHSVLPVAFSDDDALVAAFDARLESGDSTITVWQTETGNRLNTLKLRSGASFQLFGEVSIAITNDHKHLVVADKETLTTYSIADGKIQGSFLHEGIQHLVSRRLVLTPANAAVLFPLGHGDAVLLSLMSGKVLQHFRGHSGPLQAAAFSPDGKRLVTAGEDGRFKLWHVETGRELVSFDEIVEAPVFVGFSADGRTLVACGRRPTLRIWTAFPREEEEYFQNPALPFSERVELYKRSYWSLLRPEGACQRWLEDWDIVKSSWADESHAAVDTVLSSPDALPRTQLRLSCPAGGRLLLNPVGHLPACSTHGALRSERYIWKLAGELEDRQDEIGKPRFERRARKLFAALPDDTLSALSLGRSWLDSDNSYRAAAAVAARKAFDVHRRHPDSGGDLDDVYALLGSALLRLNQNESAIEYLRKVRQEDSMPKLALALARHGTNADFSEAYDLLGDYLRYHYPTPDTYAAWNILSEKVSPARRETHRKIQDLVDVDPKGWKRLNWHTDVESALSEATQRRLPVLLAFYIPNADRTERLFEGVFSHPFTRKQLDSHFVLCRIDAQQHPTLLERYKVMQLPAIIIADGKDRVWFDAYRPTDLRDFYERFLNEIGNRVGRVGEWGLLGPLDNTERTFFSRTFQPELGVDITASYPGKDGPVTWQRCLVDPVKGKLTIGQYYIRDRDAGFFAYSVLESPGEISAAFHISHSCRYSLWLNGRHVHTMEPDLMGNVVEESYPVKLRRGQNELLIKFDNDGGHSVGFALRVTDEQNTAIEGLRSHVPISGSPVRPLPLRAGARPLAVYPEASFTLERGIAVRRIPVDKEAITREWRASWGKIFRDVKPQLYYDEQTGRTGLTAQRIGRIPIAQRLGLQDGDVILSINGHTVAGDETDVEAVFNLLKHEKIWRVELLRNDEIRFMDYEIR